MIYFLIAAPSLYWVRKLYWALAACQSDAIAVIIIIIITIIIIIQHHLKSYNIIVVGLGNTRCLWVILYAYIYICKYIGKMIHFPPISGSHPQQVMLGRLLYIRPLQHRYVGVQFLLNLLQHPIHAILLLHGAIVGDHQP